ncbi:MAG TPA: UDP-N-acetylmuramoyl-L-alanine--D-glutamate ligase [Frankiaceae bacterium]|nr:UDP-N-acetylmuramoyl-L-alanine--D-glutamate ligase [Frankiaceae bacterium]
MRWGGLPVTVCGLGVSGTAAAEVLLRLGARVTVIDARENAARAAALEALGAAVVTGTADPDVPAELVVTSPGWRPDQPYLSRLGCAGVPVWGEVELAWRLKPARQRWYAVTGTNGKTTTTEMLGAMLARGERHSATAGNIGTPLVSVVTAADPPEDVAVELSSFQLHWTSSLAVTAGAILNLAPDHLDWHGSFAGYGAAKRRIWGAGTTAVYNADDPAVMALTDGVPDLVPFSLAQPYDGPLAATGPHNLANATAAATLARLAGVGEDAIAEAMRDFRTGGHRLVTVATLDGVAYVDDSKATNPHAAQRAIESFESVVWVAGGLNKGLEFDGLVTATRSRLRAAVLIGTCAEEIRDALARHAPEVPVEVAGDLHTAVGTARRLARPGDTVLLAPAAASMDQFTDYAERGDRFAAEVRALEERQ